jgi:predicted TIM-barrel fold metal-dependent hydrolase
MTSPADNLPLREFAPRAEVVTPATRVERPRFPVIDAHNHLGELLPGLRFSGDWLDRPVEQLLAVMDEANVRLVVDLDGRTGEALRRELARYQEPHPQRFAVFCGIDYDVIARERDFGRRLARALREDVAAGARGLKIWKPLGLTVRDERGKLVAPNDERLDELWATAGELNVPVLIHVADPVAFFRPLDRFNERWEELSAHPDWHFHGPQFPRFEVIIDQLSDLVSRHRGTAFIGAHVGCYAENLAWVAELLNRCPNFHVDISARLAELGRVPYRAREFFIEHADRILFGTDFPPDVEMYGLHYRFLETRDEYFPYWLGTGPPPQGRWMIYGLGLPDDVLRRVYFDNAARVLKLGV